MSFSFPRGASHGLALLASATILTTGALAQSRAAYPPGAIVQPLDTGPGAELRRNLNTLARNPASVSALNGAGQASLDMGDAEAALNFFARATEAAPSDARGKAGMGSALVHLGRAREAMPLFAEAIRLGAPEAAIAADRGLGHDSLGDPRRAQADYALALAREDDPEVRRRMALSLAISGQREAALRVIEVQLRGHDRAAWRTQAFILALTGDPEGADRTARNVMPGGADEMAPFFARLASLSPAQKAMAVHFGQFPSDGRATASAPYDTTADPGAVALAQGGATAGPPRARTRPAEPIETPRRRPDIDERPVASLIRRPLRDVAPPVVTRAPPGPMTPEPRIDDEPQVQPPPQSAPVQSAPAESATAGFSLIPQGEQPAIRQLPAPAARLADLADVVASLPSDEDVRTAARPTRIAEARPTPPPQRASRARPATPPNPSRHWVQIAGGANRAGLPATFARLRGQAPGLLGSRTPYTTPLNQTNRLLVGPFDSDNAAQAFVNQLSDKRIAAFAWTSPAGQEIERLRVAGDSRAARTQTATERRPTADTRSTRRRSEPEQRPAARRRRAN
jgi:tetratricopeptide (TPR) repeat protein